MKLSHFVFGAVCLAAVGLASDADAVGQHQIAPGGSFVPRFDSSSSDDRPFWRTYTSSPGWAAVNDAFAPLTFHFMRMTIPVDSQTFSTNLSIHMRVNAGASSNKMCLAVYSISNTGVLSASSGTHCAAGAISNQNLSRNLVLPTVSSALVAEVSGTDGAVSKLLTVLH